MRRRELATRGRVSGLMHEAEGRLAAFEEGGDPPKMRSPTGDLTLYGLLPKITLLGARQRQDV